MFVFEDIIDRVTSFLDYNLNEHSSTEMLMGGKRGKVVAPLTDKMSALLFKAKAKMDDVPFFHPDEGGQFPEKAEKNGDELIKLLKQNRVPIAV